MGLQLIVKADYQKIEKELGDLISECEVFPVAEGLLVSQFLSTPFHLRGKMPC
jgi:hypothetical protein